MPCYQVNLINVEFRIGNLEFLKEALKNLGLRYQIHGDIVNLNGMKLNLRTGQAEIQEGMQKALNKLKVGYSEVVVEAAAKKKGWLLKKKSDHKFKAVRF